MPALSSLVYRMAASPPSDSEASPPLPPEGLRTAVTFLIFVHFFFLLISIKSKTASSGLEQDLRQRAPGLTPYVQLLGMDLSYMFHLTYYDPTNFELSKETPGTFDDHDEERDLRDTEFYAELDLLGPDGRIEKTILWPPNDLKPGARFQRFQRLVAMAVGLIDSDNTDPVSDIAKGIADRVMAENQASAVKIRFRRRILQDLTLPRDSADYQAELNRDPDSAANFRLVYKVEQGREPEVYEISALRGSDGNVIISTAKSGYTSAAPQQSSSATPAPSTIVPAVSPTASPSPTGPRLPLTPIVIPTGTGGFNR